MDRFIVTLLWVSLTQLSDSRRIPKTPPQHTFNIDTASFLNGIKASNVLAAVNSSASRESDYQQQQIGVGQNTRKHGTQPVFAENLDGQLVHETQRKGRHSILSKIQPQKSFYAIVALVSIYLVCSLVYNYLRRHWEKERIAKAAQDYENDRQRFIRTGETTPVKYD